MTGWTYPDSVRHGAAFAYFSRECRERGVRIPGQHSQELWPFFLAGWLAKAKQANDLRGRKP